MSKLSIIDFKKKQLWQKSKQQLFRKRCDLFSITPILDGGVYICRAENENMQNQAAVDITVLQGKIPIQCVDMNHLANCAIIVRAQYCAKNDHFARLCCKSCVESGQIAGPPA